MTPVERVARAMAAEAERQSKDNPTNVETYDEVKVGSGGEMQLALYGRYDLTALVRAAIEALREPSEKMIEESKPIVGEIILGPPQPSYLFPHDQYHKGGRDVWQAMLSAALSESE